MKREFWVAPNHAIQAPRPSQASAVSCFESGAEGSSPEPFMLTLLCPRRVTGRMTPARILLPLGGTRLGPSLPPGAEVATEVLPASVLTAERHAACASNSKW